ncbi:N(4)-(beta-N-acetylglucosaminyl)-L-asparaginase [Dyella monticola]|uniref:N(4)-(Beta-N-acetylglucosaminyl)-L-asparaginase n=1 Tax=Dyella monticola TaxID=1927958 RepID=A0A370WRW1_9GAMM|nr:N(4)-(beta-N-acetylglucosaminyl)-L-asparaginase [Dyella monticola]RDS78767.1 N(4)-(beta-N-acetylglucosaminyl)-L-asparaginase [Dyella monticola]
MTDRRNFLKTTLLASSALALPRLSRAAATLAGSVPGNVGARVVSTWDFGVPANIAAWGVLGKGGKPLDAVETGVMVPESDLHNHSVGRAGYPDRDGHVTLDASIMDGDGSCGAVAALEHIGHPIQVARKVMENTPHVLLVADGALEFALQQGFKKEHLLTPESEKAWHEWLKQAKYTPVANSENIDYHRSLQNSLGMPGGKNNHDTIGMLAVDANGRMAGACTTSGMAWKLHGRVGDSPIIGAGLYVDNEVGGATSTGVGEEVIRNAGSFLVVELMRQGRTPQEACEEAVRRIVKKRPQATKDMQVGFLALRRDGECGAYAIQKGFTYAVCDVHQQDRLLASPSLYQTTYT